MKNYIVVCLMALLSAFALTAVGCGGSRANETVQLFAAPDGLEEATVVEVEQILESGIAAVRIESLYCNDMGVAMRGGAIVPACSEIKIGDRVITREYKILDRSDTGEMKYKPVRIATLDPRDPKNLSRIKAEMRKK